MIIVGLSIRQIQPLMNNNKKFVTLFMFQKWIDRKNGCICTYICNVVWTTANNQSRLYSWLGLQQIPLDYKIENNQVWIVDGQTDGCLAFFSGFPRVIITLLQNSWAISSYIWVQMFCSALITVSHRAPAGWNVSCLCWEIIPPRMSHPGHLCVFLFFGMFVCGKSSFKFKISRRPKKKKPKKPGIKFLLHHDVYIFPCRLWKWKRVCI